MLAPLQQPLRLVYCTMLNMPSWRSMVKVHSLVFFTLGVTQSIQSGWFFQSVFVFAAEHGFQLEDMPWLMFYSVPYTFKWVFAPLADYLVIRGYTYVWGIERLLWVLVATWCVLLLRFNHIDMLFWTIMGFASFICANMDSWLDAHRIRDYSSELQSDLLRANVLGYRLGLGFVTGLLVFSTAWFGWRWCYIVFMGSCTLSALCIRRMESSSGLNVPKESMFKVVKRVLYWKPLFSAIVLRSGDTWVQVLVVWYLIYYHDWDSARIGLVLQMCGGVASMIGVYLASCVLKRVQLDALLRYGLFVSMLLVLAWVVSTSMHPIFVMMLAVAWCFWIGFYGFFFSSWLVLNTCKDYPGTHFSMMTSLARVPTALAAWIGGPLLAAGYVHVAFGAAFIGYGLNVLAQHFNANDHGRLSHDDEK